MAAHKAQHNVGEMDYPAHERNYSGFIKLLKFGTIITAIVVVIVLYTISN
jgi:hypothetical protein